MLCGMRDVGCGDATSRRATLVNLGDMESKGETDPAASHPASRIPHPVPFAPRRSTVTTPVGGKRRDENFRTIVKIAVDHAKPVRIGVNWGSLDQDLLTQMMDENARRADADQRDAKDVYIEAMLESALRSAALAEEVGLGHD